MQHGNQTWRSILCDRGIESCRQGNWEKGLEDLKTARRGSRTLDLPARAYSYLGYAQAKIDGNIREGLKLCRFAVTQEFYESEYYLNLARAHLLNNDRKEAYRTLERGLKIDADSPSLQEMLEAEIGTRRLPVIPFFSRSHLLNRLFGSLRHALSR